MNSRIDSEQVVILCIILVGWSLLMVVRHLIIPAAIMLAGMRKSRQGLAMAPAAADFSDGEPAYVQQFGRLDRSATGRLVVIDYRPNTTAVTSTTELLPRPVRRPTNDND